MNSVLKDLAQCGDAGSLGSALRKLCAEFGSIARLEILTLNDAGKRQAVCLLRLDSCKQEQDLMAKIGADRFGEDLCVVVNMGAPDQSRA